MEFDSTSICFRLELNNFCFDFVCMGMCCIAIFMHVFFIKYCISSCSVISCFSVWKVERVENRREAKHFQSQ